MRPKLIFDEYENLINNMRKELNNHINDHFVKLDSNSYINTDLLKRSEDKLKSHAVLLEEISSDKYFLFEEFNKVFNLVDIL